MFLAWAAFLPPLYVFFDCSRKWRSSFSSSPPFDGAVAADVASASTAATSTPPIPILRMSSPLNRPESKIDPAGRLAGLQTRQMDRRHESGVNIPAP